MPEHFLNKIPQSLTPEQQAWVDGLRAAYYKRSNDEITDKNSGAYKEVERRAQALLDVLFVELPDGSCKIKDEVNYSVQGFSLRAICTFTGNSLFTFQRS